MLLPAMGLALLLAVFVLGARASQMPLPAGGIVVQTVHTANRDYFATRLFSSVYMGADPGKHLTRIELLDPAAHTLLGYPASWLAHVQLRQPTFEYSNWAERVAACSSDCDQDVVFVPHKWAVLNYTVNESIALEDTRDLGLRGLVNQHTGMKDSDLDGADDELLDGRMPLSHTSAPLSLVQAGGKGDYVYCAGYSRFIYGDEASFCTEDPGGPSLCLRDCGADPFACRLSLRVHLEPRNPAVHEPRTLDLECRLQTGGLHLHVDRTVLPSNVHAKWRLGKIVIQGNDDDALVLRPRKETVDISGLRRHILVPSDPGTCVLGTDAIGLLVWRWDEGERALTLQNGHRDVFEFELGWGVQTLLIVGAIVSWYFIDIYHMQIRWYFELAIAVLSILNILYQGYVLDGHMQRQFIHSNGYIGRWTAESLVLTALGVALWTLAIVLIRADARAVSASDKSRGRKVRALFVQMNLVMNLLMDLSQATSVRFFGLAAIILSFASVVVIVNYVYYKTVFHWSSYVPMAAFYYYILVAGVIPFMLSVSVFRLYPETTAILFILIFRFVGLHSHSRILDALERIGV